MAMGDYYWRVLAAREVMRLYRRDRARLERLALLHSAKNSAEEVLHPADETPLAEVAAAGPQDVDDAVTAARRAYESVWGRMPGRERVCPIRVPTVRWPGAGPRRRG